MSLSTYVQSSVRSGEKVRNLDAESLGLGSIEKDSGEPPLACEIQDDDPYLIKVRSLLDDGYAGVIFVGPPGTSKTWYANQIAAKLVDCDGRRVRSLQFHNSYQYEDFVEGYIPLDTGGFRLTPKHLLQMCEISEKADGKRCILVIDEISRSDPARVFGEALTYLEMPLRGRPFHLASGRIAVIPSNLIILATMNQMDRGVNEVDAALERRFAKIAMEPSVPLLLKILDENGMENELQDRVMRFFEAIQRNPNCLIGHAYFRGVADEDGLRRLWEHQLQFHFQKAFVLDPGGLRLVEQDWSRIVIQA